MENLWGGLRADAVTPSSYVHGMGDAEEQELTPERLREWECHVRALEQACDEVERLSRAAVTGFRIHWERRLTSEGS